jgi:hypothetical protein
MSLFCYPLPLSQFLPPDQYCFICYESVGGRVFTSNAHARPRPSPLCMVAWPEDPECKSGESDRDTLFWLDILRLYSEYIQSHPCTTTIFRLRSSMHFSGSCLAISWVPSSGKWNGLSYISPKAMLNPMCRSGVDNLLVLLCRSNVAKSLTVPN